MKINCIHVDCCMPLLNLKLVTNFKIIEIMNIYFKKTINLNNMS